jgi:cellulose synthase/poly-beta-1,6-N-acetylglucosamine synthase-like glycosyltransferase
LISVILPVRNGMPWLEEQLRALAAQKCNEPWEVVIADNGSTDGSRDFAQTWSDEREGFRFVDASNLHGAPAARNAGVRAAQGDLLAFCDADDCVLAGWLASCVEALEHADVVAGSFDFWSLNGIPPSPSMPAAFRQLGFLPAGLGANLAVRRKAFEEVGGFTEEMLPGEDIDLCWRLQLHGFRFDIARSAIVAKRARSEFAEVFVQAFSYGRSGPVLHGRYRPDGAHRDLVGACKSWVWLTLSIPLMLQRHRRIEWARTAGMRLGRLVGSVSERVFFP